MASRLERRLAVSCALALRCEAHPEQCRRQVSNKDTYGEPGATVTKTNVLENDR